VADSHGLFYFSVFAVTLVDHSAVPNIFVLAMVAAKGKTFSPSALFLVAVASVVLYEQTVYWMGRYARTHIPKNRFIRRIATGAATITGIISRRAKTWMVIGRFIGGVGLYIPFAFGQMGRSYVLFSFLSLTGTLFHLVLFGVPAYLLGARFESFIARLPLGAITLGMFVLLMTPFVWRQIRHRVRRRSSGS